MGEIAPSVSLTPAPAPLFPFPPTTPLSFIPPSPVPDLSTSPFPATLPLEGITGPVLGVGSSSEVKDPEIESKGIRARVDHPETVEAPPRIRTLSEFWGGDEPATVTILHPELQKPEKPKRKKKAPEDPTAGALVWEAYATAYFARYGEEAVRNAKNNALCTQIAGRLGAAEGPEVIRFYVGHNDKWYVAKCHALDYAVKDAEKLRLEWRKGAMMTSGMARSTELAAHNQQAVDLYMKRKGWV